MPGATDAVHRLDDRAVGEPGIGLEVERLVGPVGERLRSAASSPVGVALGGRSGRASGPW